MAATLLLLLLLGAAQTTATRCGRQQQCQHLQDSLALENVADEDSVTDKNDMADGDSVADGDMVAQGKKIKCKLCTKVLEKIQKLAGDDPDESAVEAALRKGCRALRRNMGRICQQLVNKYREQITEGLQNGDMPQDICTAMRICRS